jgi:queuine tRNA-ribosyltransferase
VSNFFTIRHTDNRARTGVMTLPHGTVETPVFMPVGTNAAVKAMSREDLLEIGFEIILSNTYHLYLRPGTEVIEAAGGLHAFMRWDRGILTDSGGFQVFSLAPFRKISDEGVKFRSHIDGSYHILTPEKVVDIQTMLNSDIQMQLDVCSPWETGYEDAVKALKTTAQWLARTKQQWLLKRDNGYEGKLFGIVQGNFYKDLREESAGLTVAGDTPGIAIGGLSVGEPEEVFLEYLAFTADLLPREKPRYVMGIGTPEYILAAVENGIDMFDCVFPTRVGRNGHVFTRKGAVSLKKLENRLDLGPIDGECTCKVCRTYSRAYLRHLFKAQEILCSMLASYHNLYFLHDLMKNIRAAIEEDRFPAFKAGFLKKYGSGDAQEVSYEYEIMGNGIPERSHRQSFSIQQGGKMEAVKAVFTCSLLFITYAMLFADESQDRLDVIHYGTETEIAGLIDSLKKDTSYSDDKLDAELADLAKKTQNKKILTGILAFFGNRNKGGLEERALSIIETRANEPQDTVSAAIDYFGKIKSPTSASILEGVINDGESNFQGAAIRALGNASDGGNAGEIADYLIDLYTNRDPGAGNSGTLLAALGETKSKNAIPFLAGIVNDAGLDSSRRIAALGAISKIGDDAGLEAVLGALSAPEPAVRTAAVAALSPFSGQQADNAIIENFRDPVFRTRAVAAKAAGERKLAAAIPYLKYRAEKDEAKNVREESVRALGAIGNGDAVQALENLFSEPQNPDYVRILAAEMLLNNNADSYAQKIIDAMDEAQKKHQNVLYNGCLRVLSSAKTGKLESLATRFFASGTALEKSAALDMTLNNRFTALTGEVGNLTDKKNGSLAAKAQNVLDKL